MSRYMDIGTINDERPVYREIDTTKHTQVYLATHDGEGNPLSAVQKSFISFSWGDKNIEDFDFLVVSGGDRYQKTFYTSFQENTTTNDLMDGQKYWGFHYSPNTINFGLATDGVLESTLQNFRNYFRPGISKNLAWEIDFVFALRRWTWLLILVSLDSLLSATSPAL